MTFHRSIAVGVLGASVSLAFGCASEPAPAPAPAPATATSEVKAPQETPKTQPAEVGHGGGHECGGEGAALASDVVVKSTNEAGQEVLQVGATLGTSPVVAVGDLLATPEKWAGQKVRVEGNVSAMCHHMRGWFSVATDDATGRFLRVLTSPAFLVPPESIGKTAEAEGVVEVTPIDPGMASHLASSHKLGDPSAPAPKSQVVLRATGATFTE